jgi:hypothetical protein
MMKASVTTSEQDLCTLAGIVTEDRPDLPEEGLPESLLADLMGQIRCDEVCFVGMDSGRRAQWFGQEVPFTDTPGWEDLERVHWEQYWHCQPCSYPDRTGDLRSVVKIADFYSARQFHSTGMYYDYYRPQGIEHELQLCLPGPSPRTTGLGRTVRLFFSAAPARISPSATGRCSRCYARTCTTPTWTPNAAAIQSPGSPPARPTCCT